MIERNCSRSGHCAPYATCLRGLCHCKLGFAPDKTHPWLCRQPTCANSLCLRCFASQECMHCAQDLSFLDPDNQECVTACPGDEHSLVFNGINNNKVCKQGWATYNKEAARKLSLSSVEILIIVVSCTLATVLFVVSVSFAVYFRRRKVRRQAQRRLTGSARPRHQPFSVSSVSASLALSGQDPLFDFSRRGLTESGRETRLFLAHVSILRPHTPVFKAMLWDLEKWLEHHKKSAPASRKLFRYRSFNGAVNPAAVNYSVSRNQLKRLLMILERYPMVTVDPHEGCRLLRWGQECLSRFLAHAPGSKETGQMPREPGWGQGGNNTAPDLPDDKKRPTFQLTTFRPLLSGLEKIVEDDRDSQESMLLASRSSEQTSINDQISERDMRQSNSFTDIQPICSSF